MSGDALPDVVVIDLSDGIAGSYCAKLLADLGARAVKVEPPQGDVTRTLGPFPKSGADPEASGLFLYLNTNKLGVTVDITTEEGRQQVRELARVADILIESFQPGYMAAHGLGYEELAAINPRLIVTSVTHFGQTGPYKDWQGDEITDYAMGGYMYFGGHPDREPLMVPGYQAQLHAGQQAAIASLAALRYQRITGLGQHIDVSAIEAMLSAHSWTSVAWSHEGEIMKRQPPDLIPCKDGHTLFMALNIDLLSTLLGRPELVDDPRFATPLARFANRDQLVPYIQEWAKDHTAQEIYHTAQELRIAVTPVNTMADLLESPQLKARDWFVSVDHPKLGKVTMPGFPYKMSASPPAIRRPAPRLGEHNGHALDEIRRAHSVTPRAARGGSDGVSAANTSERPLALSGLKIIEVTANWAGPLAGRHLADLGADVIKVEWAQRPATRGGHPAGREMFKYGYNRSGYFNKMNRNKYDVCLDLSKPRGRELFLRLVAEWADVVIENNSARVMTNLGLGYDTLRQVNPRIIMVSMSGFGAYGPERDYLAYGSNIEASCGLASVTGYRNDPQPYRTGSFYADPVTANLGAVAVLAALNYRDLTGEGQYIDMALQECGINMMVEPFLYYTMRGELPEHQGNRHSIYAPQGCYRCLGSDYWLVLTVRNDDEWQRLCRATGHPEWAARSEFATAEGRRTHHDEIDAMISEWTAQYDHREATRILQAAGVAAAPVLANWELLSDPHLFARGFYVPIVHPEVGVFPFPGMPWILSRTPGQVRMHAPLFGEHNQYVLREVLGLSDEEIATLYAEGITADQPAVPMG